MGEKTLKLHNKLEDDEVMVLYRNIKCTPEKINGIYMVDNRIGPTIFIDESLINRRIEYRCTLFHEAGHHYTSTTSNYIATSENYLQAIAKSKDEYRAMRWATSRLIPDAELCEAINNHCLRDCYEIAECFDVTVPFVMAKLTYLKQCFRWGGLKVKGRDIIKTLQLVGCGGW